jgi:hypothetical protein
MRERDVAHGPCRQRFPLPHVCTCRDLHIHLTHPTAPGPRHPFRTGTTTAASRWSMGWCVVVGRRKGRRATGNVRPVGPTCRTTTAPLLPWLRNRTAAAYGSPLLPTATGPDAGPAPHVPSPSPDRDGDARTAPGSGDGNALTVLVVSPACGSTASAHVW